MMDTGRLRKRPVPFQDMQLRPNSTGLRVKEFDDFRAPSRRPWLVVLAVAVLAGATWGGFRYVRGQRPPGERAGAGRTISAVPGDATTGADTVNSGRVLGRQRGRSTPALTGRDGDSLAAGAAGTSTNRLHAAELIAEAARLRGADRLPEARSCLMEALSLTDSVTLRKEIETSLGTVNVALVVSPWMIPEKKEYVVRSGDTLQKIADRFGTTVQLIQKANRIQNRNRIGVGDRYRILDHPEFRIVVRKTTNDLLLTLNGGFFRRYAVGTGAYGKTPVGTFAIRDKIVNPPWWPPNGREIPFGHPDNILGTRWMAIEATGETPPARGYGIHGTWDESSIGRQSSAGCIRMRNADVEELYMLVPIGTPVDIVER